MGESANLELTAAVPATKPLDPAYFALQLAFAELVAAKAGIELTHTVFTHTNFFMRLGFGTRQQLDENHPGWRAFVSELRTVGDKAAFVYRTYLDAATG